MNNTATLLIDCPDRKGLVATISTFLYTHGANILHADQHQDNDVGLFFMRVEWDLDGFDLDEAGFRAEFAPIAASFEMHWRLHYCSSALSMAIFVSRYLHCLADLLHRHQTGELSCRIPLVVSNHEDARALVEFHGIEFRHMPMDAASKPEVERAQVELLRERAVGVVVLARYMQVLSDTLCLKLLGRAINIHHSFLPGFKGAKPYHQAYDRGVKLVGATAHYVTPDLDEGPIIEQEIIRIDHTHDPRALATIGRDAEALALARAVRWHSERRVLLNEGSTVVFR